MNYGALVYNVIEIFVFAYASFIFLKMGQNRDQKYRKLREKFAGTISVFKRDIVHFACAVLIMVLMVVSIAQLIEGFKP